jgi:hypothetical protein
MLTRRALLQGIDGDAVRTRVWAGARMCDLCITLRCVAAHALRGGANNEQALTAQAPAPYPHSDFHVKAGQFLAARGDASMAFRRVRTRAACVRSGSCCRSERALLPAARHCFGLSLASQAASCLSQSA